MPRTLGRRIVRAVTDRLWQRDRLQMRVMDRLLSAVEEKPRGKGRRSPVAPRHRSKSSSR